MIIFDVNFLFNTILNEIPAPQYDPGGLFQMLVSDLGYSEADIN